MDYASYPPCDICGKLHPGKACHRVTEACFTCGSTGHMAGDCPKNGGNGGRGNGNDNQPATKGRELFEGCDMSLSGLVLVATVGRGAYGCILDSRDLFSFILLSYYLFIIISVRWALAQPHFLFLRQVISGKLGFEH
nr:zinc finger, CCHC-type, retrotransposon Gag domain protein [Tanacetum cinerariifolium]